MAITIKLANGQQYLVTRRDIRRAVWGFRTEQEPREIMTEADAYGRGYGQVLTVVAHQDCGDWSGYETDALRCRDAHGKTTTIPFSACTVWSEGGSDQYCVAHYEDVRTVEDEWGDCLSVSALLDIAGLLEVSREDVEVDYIALAEEFITNNPGARYYVDDMRGFANEWVLHVRIEEEEDEDKDEDLREITAKDAVWRLATAVMSREDYEAQYGAPLKNNKGGNIMKHDNLYIACVSRRPASSAIKRLLAAGADPNAPAIARYGDTPLMAACRAGHTEVVKLLLAAGADPNVVDNFGDTALHEAAGAGHTEVVKLLLAAGAGPDSQGEQEFTALHEAAGAGHAEVVKLLLAAGADPLYYNRFWETPADLADGELRKILQDAEEQALHDVEE